MKTHSEEELQCMRGCLVAVRYSKSQPTVLLHRHTVSTDVVLTTEMYDSNRIGAIEAAGFLFDIQEGKHMKNTSISERKILTSTFTKERVEAILALGMEYTTDVDTMRVRFAMELPRGCNRTTKRPEYSVSRETWEESPIIVIAAAAKYLALAEENEDLREMMENPIYFLNSDGTKTEVPLPGAFIPVKDVPEFRMSKTPYALDHWPTNETNTPKKEVEQQTEVELPQKGLVHREPNQNEDGTIGDTGRFL